MSDLIVKIDGGLGNQLFQYAAGYSLAKRMGVKMVLDLSFFDLKLSEETASRNLILTKFNIPSMNVAPKKAVLEHISKKDRLKLFIKKSDLVVLVWKALKKIPLASSVIQSLKKKPKPQKEDSNIFIQYSYLPIDDKFYTMQNIVFTHGQYMSEKYFIANEADIRSFYTLKDPLSVTAQEQENKIKYTPNAISLHVRRGDYASTAHVLATHGATSLDYYKNAVVMMQKLYGSDAHFFIFSDDPSYIRENFGFIQNQTIMTGDVDYPQEDIHLMSQCKHHIIANSTFSWWGAWLNPNKDKTVIAPRWWFARETMKTFNTMDICPDGWVLL